MNLPRVTGKVADAAKGLGYRGHIEGLRALAILLVVAAHVGIPGLSGGFVGVDVFFVVSGYLITGLLVAERAASGRIDFADFYARRIRRLLPAWMLVLLVTCVSGLLLVEPAQQVGQAEAGLAAALWVSNLHFAFGELDYFAPAVETNLFLHTWSLGVEEQFYLIWPLLVAAALSLRSKAALSIALLIVLAVSFSVSLWLSWTKPQMAFYLMPARAWQFALGALAFIGQRGTGGHRRLSPWLAVAGFAALVFSAVHLTGAAPYPGLWALLPSLGAVALLLSTPDSMAHRCLSLQALQWIGRRSYGWYLWHWPVLLVGAMLLGAPSVGVRALLAVVALLLAAVTYEFLEQPLRASRRLRAAPRAVIAGGLWLVILAMSCTWSWRNYAEQEDEHVRQDVVGVAGDSEADRLGCGDDWRRNGGFVSCWFGPANAPRTAVLMGDSVAAQWTPAMREVFSAAGWRLMVNARFSCPMPEGSFFSRNVGRTYATCDHWRQALVESIARLKPDLVLISSTDTYPLSGEQWTNGTIHLLEKISPYAGRIILLRATPTLPGEVAACGRKQTRLREALSRSSACAAPVEGLINDVVYSAQRDAVGHFPNAATIDLTDLVCPAGICRAHDGTRKIYQDDNHLDRNFSRSLGPAIGQTLQLQSAPKLVAPEPRVDER